MTFHIGQQVVCIDASGLDQLDRVRKDAIYTVRWCGEWTWEGDTYAGVRLSELNPRFQGIVAIACQIHKLPEVIDAPYEAERFRPLKKTERLGEVEKLKRFCNPAHMHETV
jgi:hypothetical protein